jgi:HlyD family secretion protein
MMKLHRQTVRRSRSGGASRRLLVAIGVISVVALIGGYVYSQRSDDAEEVITRRPTVGEFVNDIVERGEIESSSNIELRCEVSSAQGVRILEIVDEGTPVNVGDTVVQLDDSSIRKDLTAQEIAVNTVQASYSKAKNEFEAAEIARKEYEEGTFVQEEQKLESDLFVAKENFRRAENFYTHSCKLAVRGYITDTQLESDKFAVSKYKKDLDAAETKLMVLRTYTKPKTLKKHDSDINTAKASVAAEEAKLAIETEKLDNLKSQLEKCVIKAPSAGQVVFNNVDRWRQDEFFIRKGGLVRERQVIVKLPDVTKMQVKAKVGEARVDRVKPGMSTVVLTEALRDMELKGTVSTVSAYASGENWFNPNVKEYDAVIVVANPPATLKPGMSAQVKIRVETIPEAVQVPVQTVIERDDKHYCIVRDSHGKLAAREVLIGSTNDKFIVVKDGVTATDDIVMNPRAHVAQVGLKEVDDAPAAKPKPEETQTAGGSAPRGAT